MITTHYNEFRDCFLYQSSSKKLYTTTILAQKGELEHEYKRKINRI